MTGRSFEGSSSCENRSDASSFISKNNMMIVPEDDAAPEEPCFGGLASPQTEPYHDGDERGVLPSGREKQLSVIFSEN